MQNKDWLETVEDIFGSVLSAVESQDYSGLSKNIEKKVNKAVGKVNDTFSDINDKINANLNPGTNQKKANATQDWMNNRKEQERTQGKQGYTNRMYSSQATDTKNGNANGHGKNPKVPVKKMQYPQLYRQNPPGTYSGPVFKVLGAIGTTLFGSATFILTLLGVIFSATGSGAFGIWLADFITTACLGSSIASLAYGNKMQNLVNRFKTYVKQIGDRQYCELERLAATVGKKKSFVEKEIRSMISKGYFLQGHLDDTGKTLITSDSMYQNYLNAENSRKLREQKEIEDIQIREITNGYPEKVRQILEEGERYIQHVHEANDAIPGEVMSEKLYRLEDIMRRIFEQLKRDPSSADDLQKLMKYYLPTTTKLIDAYKDLDGKPSYGENNIANTKKEIEDTMDVITAAFGKIFDDMFEDAAWDISTEISTMKTMLAKEGLTGERDFVLDKNKQGSTVKAELK